MSMGWNSIEESGEPSPTFVSRLPVEPVNPPAMPRPKWRTLFFKDLGDLLVCLLLMSFIFIPIAAISSTMPTAAFDREDRWSFTALPGNLEALRAWGLGQNDLSNFRAERVPGQNEIVLKYGRNYRRGPALPTWYDLGFRGAYLKSAPPLPKTSPLPPSLLVVMFLGTSLTFGGVGLYRLLRAAANGGPWIRLTSLPSSGWVLKTIMALLALRAFSVTYLLLLKVLHLDQGLQDPVSPLLTSLSGWNLSAMGFVVVVVAPVAEELFFRGCLFGRFRAYGYVVSGAIISASLFTLVHGQLLLSPVYFSLGLGLAWLYHRTGSIWPSTILHGLNNALAVGFMIFMSRS